MDEVDGMAGNEDRGGVAELIQLLKGSRIPVVCMCNDRNHPKIRSLANHCFDLRFHRPKVEQIRVRFPSIIGTSQTMLSAFVLFDPIPYRQHLKLLNLFSCDSKL
jgi:replication factor C subunit 1